MVFFQWPAGSINPLLNFRSRISTRRKPRDITLWRDAEKGFDPHAEAHGAPTFSLMKPDNTRRRITFEALDSGPPVVANDGNPGDVWIGIRIGTDFRFAPSRSPA